MRHTVAAIAAAVSLLVSAGAALAAPPTNDTYAGATTVSTPLPFNAAVDTTEATTDALDAELNEQCGAPATEASVWYQFTPETDMFVLVDTSGSDYSTGVGVVIGSPGSFEVISCAPQAAAFAAEAGVTYSILIFDDVPGGTSGGNLQLAISETEPPPEVDLTVDSVAAFDPATGSVTVTGTVTCTGDGVIDAFIDVSVRQRVGRFVVQGFGFEGFTCDGTTQEWSAQVFGDTGLFRGGRAEAFVFAVACTELFCGEDFEEVALRVRR